MGVIGVMAHLDFPFTIAELRLVKKQIVGGKAYGDDSISPEVQ